MLLSPDSEYTVILDSCVLAPMPLCDTLLRLAEEPALYRPLWSDRILQEVGGVLVNRLGRTTAQRDRRIAFMRSFFPEASVAVPESLVAALTAIPDENDRHVVAAAIRGKANVIVTLNQSDFPEECLSEFDIVSQTPDQFLVNHFHLNPDLVLDKLDAQAIAIRLSREQVVAKLSTLAHAPEFAKLVLQRT